MRLKEEHQPGCGCAACQGKYQQPVDNIDGYASGFELAPDPNQEISPELMDNPGFIQNIINQILQQIGGGEMEEQLDPMISKDLPGLETTQSVLSPNQMQVKGPGGKPYFYDPCLGMAHDPPIFTNPMVLSPGGGGVGPSIGPGETGEEEGGFADAEMGSVGAFGDIEDQGFTTNIEKIREYIASQIKSLSEESSKVEEGSCGYSQSATGESLKTPGGIKGIEAQSRTNRMKKGGLDEHDPKAPQNHKVQTRTASDDKSWFKYSKK